MVEPSAPCIETAEHSPIQTVPEGVSCAACRYDLRLLPANSRCPECGAPVSESIVHWREKQAHSPWTVPGFIFVLVLTGQAIVLLGIVFFELTSLPRYRVRLFSIHDEVCLMAAGCYIYLLIRTRPRAVDTRRTLVLKYVLLFVILLFWFILINPIPFDRLFMRLGRSLGWF